jgi:TM2 domain-containing membrane protein YozV
MEKVWEIKNPAEYLKPRKTRSLTGPPRREEKNPARAYTLSLLIWGMGQNYNDQRGKGLLFQLSMIFFCTAVVLAVFFFDLLIRTLRSYGMSAAHAFILAEALLLCVLVFWKGVAGNAYHVAAKTRSAPFRGVQSRVSPFLCSLLIPGWGQFLNGQPVKGSIFSGLSVLGLFSLVSVPSILLVWPSLEASDARYFIEELFALAALFSLFVPFIWLFGCYDALRVSLDDLKKEPLWERIKAANNRRRTQGWVQGVFPGIKTTLLLGLFLAFAVIAVYYYFPKDYYIRLLDLTRARLAGQGMTIVPEFIVRLLSLAKGT